MQLRSVSIERFKRIESVSFDLSELNILIGGNNSGKSTIIQAIHFAFTLFQSLESLGRWPGKNQTVVTVSPSQLIYMPSDDAYSLGYGGRLLESEDSAIAFTFTFSNGEIINLGLRKGRITNILVAPDNVELARRFSVLSKPYTIFSPGLAGVSRTEQFISDGVLLRVIARGDANIVLRNILFRLHNNAKWTEFENDLAQIFPGASIEISYEPTVDQFISVHINEDKRKIPLDLAGTGLLQAIQILAYLHLFSPQLIILDEPDSHLHPNNQRLLCSLLSSIAVERGVQVIMTTHSRHVLDTLTGDASILWVQDGGVQLASVEDQVDLLLELGALDIKERISQGRQKAIILTEDRATNYLQILLANSGFDESQTVILPYNGVTTVHLLGPLIKQIRDISDAKIILHRDRDYLEPDEVESWKKSIRELGAEPFVTAPVDVEGYFCTDEYIKHVMAKTGGELDIEEVKLRVSQDEEEEVISSYVNGRVDVERKNSNIGKLDYGKLSAAAARKVREDLLGLMKGKRKLAKLRSVFHSIYGRRFEVDKGSALPRDGDLAKIGAKIFRSPDAASSPKAVVSS
jgi:ABC-type cobalamin/Fe3+-siderophores transport system ATPase subunit